MVKDVVLGNQILFLGQRRKAHPAGVKARGKVPKCHKIFCFRFFS
jgi:hypothetical protein